MSIESVHLDSSALQRLQNSASRHELAQRLFQVSHRTGEFRLRSGKISSEYFDKYQFEANPDLLWSIASHLKPLIPSNTEVLGALEMGGIPIATALSLQTGLPVVFIRKEAKTYGTCQLAEGPSVKSRRVTLVEDVITTGGQVVISARELRQRSGARVEHVVCVIDRSEGQTEKILQAGLNMHALFKMEELKMSAADKQT